MEFSAFDNHLKLSKMLKDIKSRFLLLYNNHVFIRNLYNDYEIESILISKHGFLSVLTDEFILYNMLKYSSKKK